MRIVLASASPRRRELLEQAGIDFEILIGSTRECITKEEPGEIVEELSLAKALGVAKAVTGDAVIIGADTIVAKGNRVLGKPKDAEDAHQMLAMLQGEKHQVYTGVTLLQKKGDEKIIRSFHERTDVFMTSMSDHQVCDGGGACKLCTSCPCTGDLSFCTDRCTAWILPGTRYDGPDSGVADH